MYEYQNDLRTVSCINIERVPGIKSGIIILVQLMGKVPASDGIVFGHKCLFRCYIVG